MAIASSVHLLSQPVLPTVRTSNLERCRICLQESSPLISLPCDCRQELGMVHEKCFSKWVQVNAPPNLSSSIIDNKCEICHKNMKIQIKTEIKIKSLKQITQSHRCCEISAAFITVGAIIFLIYLCVRGIIGNIGGSFIMYIVYGVVIIFLLVVLKVVIQLTLRIFKKRQVTSLRFISQPLVNKEK